MEWNLIFFVNSILLGAGLAMDAFSVSLTNGLNESRMKKSRMCFIAGIYAFFQFAMPMIGWVCIHTIVELFSKFDKLIPWIALVLLVYIGGKMIWESFHGESETDNEKTKKLTFSVLMIQGIATSIDALSVGFTIADYGLLMAFTASLIIAAVTFLICMAGLVVGKKAGAHLGSKATLFGGIILVGIGIEIFVKSLFF
ncbi:MAG: manganese efflux pump MntP family protein [Treponemataceae bacterium]|nr:manganese efflux pump MntP family protein [Treponemataceae bacterium]